MTICLDYGRISFVVVGIYEKPSFENGLVGEVNNPYQNNETRGSFNSFRTKG